MRKREREFLPDGNDLDAYAGDPGFVIALARGLAVLRAFKRGDKGLGNQELAARTGLAKSTISRLTYTLSSLGYLEYSQDTARYTLSVSVLALGFSTLGGLSVRDVARPFMQELADQIGSSVALGAADRRTMVYIEHCRGPGLLQVGIQVGSHIRMATSAMGRAHLASIDQAARERILDELCSDADEAEAWRIGVARAVEQYQGKGFVTSVGEWKNEMNAVGVPLNLYGAQPFALNCSGASHMLTEDMLDDAGRALMAVAAKIRQALGET